MSSEKFKTLFPRLRSLWFGITLPYRAGRLILSNRALFIWSVVPIVLTIVLYIYGISSLQEWAIAMFQNYIVYKWGFGPESWAAWFFVLFGKAILWMIAALTFAFASSMVASPFNDLLAEKAEGFADPPLPDVTHKSLRQKIELVGVDLFKTVAASGAAIFAIVFFWVPILNIAAFVLAFLLVTFQFISYPQSRRGIGLKQGARFLVRHVFACAGFGAVLSVLFAIPFFSSFVLPIAVVGGTLLAGRAPGSTTKMALK